MSSSASRIRPTIGSCAANRRTAGCIAGRTARRSATATPARPAGSGRSPSATRRCSRPMLGHLTAAVEPRGAFALWLPGRCGSRGRARAARRASASTSSRSCCAGTARSPTSAATCRSRPASSSERTAAPRTTSARLHRGPFAGPGRVVASGHDVAPLAVPADGVLQRSCRRRPSPDAPPAEPTCDHRPSPDRRALHPRSASSRRPSDQADAGARGPRAARRHQGSTPTASWRCATSTWSSPRATSSSWSGRPGAGKSTLIKLLIRDEIATSGAVVLDGQDLARLPRRQVPKMRRKIGIIFQDFKLLPTKTVWENVAFALEVTGTPRRKIRPAVDRVLALVGPDRAGRADPVAAVRRRAAADRHRPRARPRPAADHRRRADRQPRPAHQLGDPPAPAADQRAGRDGPDGHPQRRGRDRPAQARRRARGGPDHPRRGRWRLPPRGLSRVISFVVVQHRAAPGRGSGATRVMSLAATATMVLMLLLLAGFWIIQTGPAGRPPVHRAEGRGRRLPPAERHRQPGRRRSQDQLKAMPEVASVDYVSARRGARPTSARR